MENNDKEIGGRLGFREILVNECVSLERLAECEGGGVIWERGKESA